MNIKSLLLSFLLICYSVCSSQTYKRKYFPFRITNQLDLIRPSIPFPGIYDISVPPAKFFKRIKMADTNEIRDVPNLSQEFGKKKFLHYYPGLFNSNEGLNIQNFINKIDRYDTILNLMKKVVNEIKVLEDDEDDEKETSLTSYYKNKLSEYEPGLKFFDIYSSRQYYVDLINFINKMTDSVEFYRGKKNDPLSEFFIQTGKLIVDKMNEFRRLKGLPPTIEWVELPYFNMLEHCLFMSNLGKLTHDGFNQRADELSNLYPLRSAAENLASFQNFELISKEQIADKFMDLWINSEGHRLNMEKDMNRCTVAVYKNENNVYYSTMFLFKVK